MYQQTYLKIRSREEAMICDRSLLDKALTRKELPPETAITAL